MTALEYHKNTDTDWPAATYNVAQCDVCEEYKPAAQVRHYRYGPNVCADCPPPPPPPVNILPASPTIYIGGAPQVGDVIHVTSGENIKPCRVIEADPSKSFVRVKTAHHQTWDIGKWNLLKQIRSGRWRWEIPAPKVIDYAEAAAENAELTRHRNAAIRRGEITVKRRGGRIVHSYDPGKPPRRPDYEFIEGYDIPA